MDIVPARRRVCYEHEDTIVTDMDDDRPLLDDGRLATARTTVDKSSCLRAPSMQLTRCLSFSLVLLIACLAFLVSLHPLVSLYGRTVARSCRGVDPTRFALPYADPRSPVHCAAYRVEQLMPTSHLPASSDSSTRPNSLFPSSDGSAVLVHYVLAMEESGSTLSFLQYVSILSAVHYHQPTSVLLHHRLNLTGPWFDQLSRQLGSQLVLVRVRDVTSIFSRPVVHYAHKADVIRLEAVLQYGGLYLDSDMVMLRSMRGLMAYEALLGEEHIGRGTPSFYLNLWSGVGSAGERLRASDGLANAVIAGVRNSSFIYDWYQRYRTFDNRQWDWHSCKLPLLMASEEAHRDDVLTLNTVGFFHVNYGDLSAFFETDDVDLRDQYAIHFSHLSGKLGEERWNKYFGAIRSMEHALEVHRGNNFGRLLRGLVFGDTTW